MAEVNIVCVLKSGGDFKPEHVERLEQQVRAHVSTPMRFWCMTDYPPLSFHHDILVLPLVRNWPGWWSKLEVFDHFDNAFYLDLDTTICGDITALVQQRDQGFFALYDLDRRNHPGKLASGLMRWRGDFGYITRRFALNPEAFMQLYRGGRGWGDQGFIAEVLKQDCTPWRALQDEQPGAIISFKLDQHTRETCIICHHGKPRPWDVPQ